MTFAMGAWHLSFSKRREQIATSEGFPKLPIVQNQPAEIQSRTTFTLNPVVNLSQKESSEPFPAKSRNQYTATRGMKVPLATTFNGSQHESQSFRRFEERTKNIKFRIRSRLRVWSKVIAAENINLGSPLAMTERGGELPLACFS